jgi:hypothetical protein
MLVVVASSCPFTPLVSVAGFEGLEEFLADHFPGGEMVGLESVNTSVPNLSDSWGCICDDRADD